MCIRDRESSKDATDFVTTYIYDEAGQVLREEYSRSTSSLAEADEITEARLYTYDLEGRVIKQSVATLTGSTWVEGDVSNTDITPLVTCRGKALMAFIQQ